MAINNFFASASHSEVNSDLQCDDCRKETSYTSRLVL